MLISISEVDWFIIYLNQLHLKFKVIYVTNHSNWGLGSNLKMSHYAVKFPRNSFWKYTLGPHISNIKDPTSFVSHSPQVLSQLKYGLYSSTVICHIFCLSRSIAE